MAAPGTRFREDIRAVAGIVASGSGQPSLRQFVEDVSGLLRELDGATGNNGFVAPGRVTDSPLQKRFEIW